MTDAEIATERLTGWVRDNWDSQPKGFIGDISMLLVIAKGAVKKKEPDLLPCPFCGSEDTQVGGNYVYCRACDCDGPHVPDTDQDVAAEQQVIDAWNKRAAK